MINYPRYEELLGTKLGLDTEIAVYRALLDSEERRVARWVSISSPVTDTTKQLFQNIYNNFCVGKIFLKMATLLPMARKTSLRVRRREYWTRSRTGWRI